MRCAVCAYSSCINSCCLCAKSILAQSGNWSTEERSKEKTPQLKLSDERGGKQWEVKKMRGQKVYELKTRDKERERKLMFMSTAFEGDRMSGTEEIPMKEHPDATFIFHQLPFFIFNFFFKVQLFSQSH